MIRDDYGATLSGREPLRGLEDAFLAWVNSPHRNRLKSWGAAVKRGTRVLKTVEISHFGNPETKETRKRELRLRSIEAQESKHVDFDDSSSTKNTWFCNDEEIERLTAFLQGQIDQTGRYQIIDTKSADAALLHALRNSDLDPEVLADNLSKHPKAEEVVQLLADSNTGRAAVHAAILASRRDLVLRLKELIAAPSTTETTIQNLIGDAYWIFGGRYVGVADRRSLTPLDQTDIPLLGSDRVLHIVELKKPCVDHLITKHRNHWIVGQRVHEATAQAMNYLRSLDEQGLIMSGLLKREADEDYDMSRVFATVVIGRSDYGSNSDRDTVLRTLRQYNAGLSRVEVITYDQLVDNALRALSFEYDPPSVSPDDSSKPKFDIRSFSDEPPF